MIGSSSSEQEGKPDVSRRKRKPSGEPRYRQASPTERSAKAKRARVTTPPPLPQDIKGFTPGTPKKSLQLTAPNNPSPSKKDRMQDVIGASIAKEDLNIKPTAAFFQTGVADASGPSSLNTMTAVPASMTAPALDFDTDPFLFRPEDVEVSHWPGGRLPYEVLVGVYLQVGGTRSRLAIVRILSK